MYHNKPLNEGCLSSNSASFFALPRLVLLPSQVCLKQNVNRLPLPLRWLPEIQQMQRLATTIVYRYRACIQRRVGRRHKGVPTARKLADWRCRRKRETRTADHLVFIIPYVRFSIYLCIGAHALDHFQTYSRNESHEVNGFLEEGFFAARMSTLTLL